MIETPTIVVNHARGYIAQRLQLFPDLRHIQLGGNSELLKSEVRYGNIFGDPLETGVYESLLQSSTAYDAELEGGFLILLASLEWINAKLAQQKSNLLFFTMVSPMA